MTKHQLNKCIYQSTLLKGILLSGSSGHNYKAEGQIANNIKAFSFGILTFFYYFFFYFLKITQPFNYFL